MARRKRQVVATYQMVEADPITQELPLGGAQELTLAEPSTNGHVPATSPGDDYWARAMGKSFMPPPAAIRRRSDDIAPRSPGGVEPASDRAASYWDRARRVAPRRASLPERPAAAPQPAAVISVAPEAKQGLPVSSEDAVIVPAALAASEPAPVPNESLAAAQPESGVRGAHVRKDDSLGAGVRGAHVKADYPLAAGWDEDLTGDVELAGVIRGAHVKADDPLAVTIKPAHASNVSDALEPAETEAKDSGAGTVAAKTRHRRWGVVPVAGAAAALAVGLGAGSAYGYFHSSGSGSGQTSAGTPSNVVLGQATIGTVSTYLVPGGTGDLFVKVNNPNNKPVTITGISQTGNVAVVGSASCTSDTAWPTTLGNSGVSVPTSSSLNISVPALSGTSFQVDVPNAASMTTASASACQGATFHIPVTITVRLG